jgi:2-keto-3-deoxy-L-rhamnonate aldolase RhmA
MATDTAWADKVIAMGYTMIATGTDTGLLQQGFSHLIQHVEKRG